MNKSLARRYLGYFVIVAVSVVVISLNAATLFHREAYSRTVDILMGTNTIMKNIIENTDPADINDYVHLVAVDDIRITIIRSDGVVTADSHADTGTLDNHADRPEINAALNDVPGVSKRYSDSLHEDLIYVALPVFHTEEGSLVIRSSMSVNKIDKALRETLLNIVVIGIVTFLALALISYLNERRLTAPFVEIQKAAEAYSAGELGYYLSISSPEDAHVVAEAMNTMAHSLKKRLAELTESRNELDAIFEGLTEAVVVLDENLNILQINHSALHIVIPGITDPRGLSLVEAFRNTQLQALAQEAWETSILTEGLIDFEGPMNLSFHIRGNRIAASENQPTKIAVVIVMTDITKMRQLETVRRDFVANVSHELKTPITNVKGYLETLVDGALEDKATTERFLAIAVRNADRLNAILDDLLSLSRLEQQGGEVMETETRGIDGVINSAIQTCNRRADGEGIEIQKNIDDAVFAQMNVLLIEQALVNLIDNAVKYSKKGAAVVVEAVSDGLRTTITVEDSGTGIPEKDLPRIFERFYRVDKARSRELGGTGLGLAIVKHIALVHGGSVHVESTLGQGSRFTLILPAGAEPGEARVSRSEMPVDL